MENNSSDPEDQPKPVLSKKKRAVRFIRNTLIGTAVVVIVLVGAGAAYTWYMGQTPPPKVGVEESTQSTQQAQQLRAPAPSNSPIGAAVQSLTSPVAPGQNVSMIVKTKPLATCEILVEYNKIASKDSGLIKKVADDFGIVSWTWTVDATAPEGKWPAKVTCELEKKSAVVIGDLVVSTKATEEN